MQRYILRRFGEGVLALFALAVLVFVLARLTGNPLSLMLPLEATPADRARLAASLGLDQPYYVQFYRFLSGALHGDFGFSIRYGQPAATLFFQRLPNSLSLAAISFALALPASIFLGVVAAAHKNTHVETIINITAVLGMSLPSFWLGLMLIEIFSVALRILPVVGPGGPDHYVLPAVTLAAFLLAGEVRLVRSSMIEALDSEFVRLAQVKGVSEAKILWWHCLRNALMPVVSFSGVYFGILVMGAVVTETVFAWPGVGQLAYQAVLSRDYPVLQVVVILVGALTIATNLAVDVLYGYLDPKIRYR